MPIRNPSKTVVNLHCALASVADMFPALALTQKMISFGRKWKDMCHTTAISGIMDL